MNAKTQVSTSLMTLILLLAGAAGCAPAATQPPIPTESLSVTQPPVPTVASPAPTLFSGWETHSGSAAPGQCAYAIDHPADLDGTSQDTYSWLLSPTSEEPSGPAPNFIYISVIPDDFQGGPGEIYNYDPAETQTLLDMQAGESRSLRDFDPSLADSFTYTRLPDTALGDQTAQTYENTQPWEFPAGTKEIRYYLKANGCTYLIGGYMDTAGSGQPGAIDEELFDQVMATFRLAP